MIKSKLIVLIACLLVSNGIQGLETIINDGQIIFTTTVEGDNLRVLATSETLGYIGWGISPDGSMTGADMVMGGFDESIGEGYLKDYIGTGNSRPTEDEIQNVELISASQNETHTSLEFIRALDTGDYNQDLVITDGILFVIWAIGPKDLIQYHSGDRGSIEIDLLGSESGTTTFG